MLMGLAQIKAPFSVVLAAADVSHKGVISRLCGTLILATRALYKEC